MFRHIGDKVNPALGKVILKLQHDQIDFRLLIMFETPVTFNEYDPFFPKYLVFILINSH